MKTGRLLALFFILCTSALFSQNPVEIGIEGDPNGYFQIYCTNRDFCNYIVKVDAKLGPGMKASLNLPFRKEVRPGRTDLFRVTMNNTNTTSPIKYSYTYAEGCIDPVVSPDFIYLLPVGNGKETEVFLPGYVRTNEKEPDPKDWYAIGFKMGYGDTVYAARRGVVVGYTDTVQTKSGGGVSMVEAPFVEIVHGDCSFGKYEMLSGVFVSPGQSVEAGDPIGLAGGKRDPKGPHVRFSVHYNTENTADGNNRAVSLAGIQWAYVPLVFCTKENHKTRISAGNKYSGLQSDSLIMLEMNKSDIKKWKKNKASPRSLTLKSGPQYQGSTGKSYDEVDMKMLQIPDSLTKTTEGLAGYIRAHFTTELERTRAVYCWITRNISYDVENMFALNFYEKKEEKIAKPLKTGKGICENYAALFTDICSKLGINSYVIEGYTKQNGMADYIPHAWCGAMIDSTWYLFDPTWGSGYVNGGTFYRRVNNENFMAAPSSFIKSHMPFDCLWQFLDYPLTNQEFYDGRIQTNTARQYYNYQDSIRVYLKQDHMEQLAASARRIEQAGIKNSLIFDRLQHLKLEIEHTRQNNTIDLFNTAVTDYNNGTNRFNDFIRYRNKQFMPHKTDSEIRGMMDAVENYFNDAKSKLAGVTPPDEKTAAMMVQLSKSIADTEVQLAEQRAWLKKYFSKPAAERKYMFYENIQTKF